MANRQSQIAKSIIFAILSNEDGLPSRPPSFLSRVFGLFNLYWLAFQLVRADLFSGLREFWAIKDQDYRASFGYDEKDKKKKKHALQPMGDMGYSGSTFFRTSDSAYLVKSVPRSFEHNFFKNDMLIPYTDHSKQFQDYFCPARKLSRQMSTSTEE
jgi:hypothetical protein